MIIKRILLAVPLLIAIGYMIDCWIKIATTNNIAVWQHYVALVFIGVVIYFFFKDFTKAIISTALFLVAGTFNLFSMTASLETSRVGIGAFRSPPFNSLALGLFFLFVVLNFVTIINLYLDYKERKNKE